MKHIVPTQEEVRFPRAISSYNTVVMRMKRFNDNFISVAPESTDDHLRVSGSGVCQQVYGNEMVDIGTDS